MGPTSHLKFILDLEFGRGLEGSELLITIDSLV